MQRPVLWTVQPLLQLCALFTLAPPPSCYTNWSSPVLKKLLNLLFTLYVLVMQLTGHYVTYINIVTLLQEVEHYQLEGLTAVLGTVQKIFFSLYLLAIHVNMLRYYGRLGELYLDITSLEREIALAEQPFGGAQQQRLSFHWRLALRSGSHLLLLLVLLPRVTVPALTDFMDRKSKFATELIMLVLQLKCCEFCVLVQLMEELLLRLQHSLQQLKAELALITSPASGLLQALGLALRTNQLLLARSWWLVSRLEDYFMLPMLLLFLYNGLAIVHVLNWAYIQAVNPEDCCRYWRIGNVLVLLTNLLVPCYIGQCCINTYKAFTGIVHSISLKIAMPELLNQRLRQYVMQLHHLKLRLSCGNLFDINLRWFGAMLVTITGYTIILIQFKLQAEIEQKRQRELHLNLAEKTV